MRSVEKALGSFRPENEWRSYNTKLFLLYIYTVGNAGSPWG